jgi:alanyl-tRNA synthetase
LCGLRAFADYAAKDAVLSGLARELSTSFDGVPAALAKLRADSSALSRSANALRTRLAEFVARELLEKAPRLGTPPLAFVVALFPDEPIEYVRTVAGRVAQTPTAVAVIGGGGAEGVRVVVERGVGAARFDCGAAMKRLAAAVGGRGGGRPERAEGMLPRGASLVELARAEAGRLEGA